MQRQLKPVEHIKDIDFDIDIDLLIEQEMNENSIPFGEYWQNKYDEYKSMYNHEPAKMYEKLGLPFELDIPLGEWYGS